MAHGARLDYETAHSHTLTIRATHAVEDLPGGHIVSAVISVTITVTDVDESPHNAPPVSPPAPPVSPPTPPALALDPAGREVAENAPGGARVGAPVAARGGTGLTYSISGSAAFTVEAATGQIRVAAGAALDHETAPSHTVTVSVADAGGRSASATVTIDVADVDEPPARPDAPAVDAPADAPRTALDVTWTAPANTGPPITGYDLRYREQGEGEWAELASPGALTSATIAGLDPDTTYEVQVAASNDEGTSGWSESGTGATGPEDGGPGSPELLRALRRVVENAPAGTAVGAPVAPASAAEGLIYSIRGSGAFTVDPDTGQIRVAAGAVLDHEARQSYSVVVIVGSSGEGVRGLTSGGAEVSVTIRVTDGDEPPPRPDAPSVLRSSSSPESELDVTWTGPEMTGRPPITSYDIAHREADGGEWTERRLDGSPTRTTLTGLRADALYHVRIRARNDEGVSAWSDPGTGSTSAAVSSPPTPPDGPRPPAGPTTPGVTTTPDDPTPPDGPGAPDAPETTSPESGATGPTSPQADPAGAGAGSTAPARGGSAEGSAGNAPPSAAWAGGEPGTASTAARGSATSRGAGPGPAPPSAAMMMTRAVTVGVTGLAGLFPFLVPPVPARRRRKERPEAWPSPASGVPASAPAASLFRVRAAGARKRGAACRRCRLSRHRRCPHLPAVRRE